MAVVRFGSYELDGAAGQLRRRGAKIRLRDQSVQVLSILVDHPGEVVSREELCHVLWPNDVAVDYENNLNAAVGRLREALGDSARHPRFIETLPRRGYRFIASVECESAPPRTRLFVLPFLNTSGDPSQDYFSDAITDEIITQLASLNAQRLAVIARTTSMRYRNGRKGIAEIARELNVAYIVEGGVRKESERISVNVQVVRVSDQMHVFAKRFDASVHEILGVQARLAKEIAAAIGVEDPAATSRPATTNLTAYNEFIQGRHAMGTLTERALSDAKQHFDVAIERDPRFALAFDALAEVYWWIGYLGYTSPKDAFSKGVLYAIRALEIDNSLGETHALLAMYYKQLDYDWPAATREMLHALELSPASATVHCRHGMNLLMPQARFDEALAELDFALETDPLSPYFRMLHSILLVLAHRFDEAIVDALTVVDLEPNSYWGYLVLGSSYRELGMYEKAIEAHRRALAASGRTPSMMGWLGMSLALAGEEEEARALLATLHVMAKERYIPATSFAWIHHGLGERDAEFEWLDRAVEERDQLMMPIKSYAFFDCIRSDPRFQALVEKMRLEP